MAYTPQLKFEDVSQVDGESPRPSYVYPGAEPPDRERTVNSSGVRIQVYEWGPEDAPPLLLAHGGFDFARTFDVFAPLLAKGGWRVVSWDHRGHGRSEHTALYGREADCRDLLAVTDSTTHQPCPAVGHSKGGALFVQTIMALPHRFSRFVAIDALGVPGRNAPDMDDVDARDLMRQHLQDWLDSRRVAHERKRKPGSLEELAERRGRMNPRLSPEWLRYLARVGAREDDDGYRWTVDPALIMGGIGPWRMASDMGALKGIGVPILALIGTEDEPMGWGATEESLREILPEGTPLKVYPDTGHFLHIERPQEIARDVLEFLK